MNTEFQHGHPITYWMRTGAAGARSTHNITRWMKVRCKKGCGQLICVTSIRKHEDACNGFGIEPPVVDPQDVSRDARAVEQLMATERHLSVERVRELCRVGCKHLEKVRVDGRKICADCGTEFFR